MRSNAFESQPIEVELFTPRNDVANPIISIVIPALNESVTIGTFLDWCHEGIAKIDVPVEVIIVDSSTDETPEIALENGARVLRVPKLGLGRAYIDALPFTRGKYLILGDADCTYDFRELMPFYEAFVAGNEYVMGSRFKGSIEAGAMPPLHQYFGTPLTTWILNVMYGTDFSDIHCGMRGITRDAFQRMNMASQSWEYASEMVLKSVHMGLKRAEVPVRFLKDMEGRTSHHVRAGWFSPWKAGWINLKAMFVFGADFFLWWPGLLFFMLGSAGWLSLAFGPRTINGVGLSLNTMLFCLVFSMAGLQMLLTAVVEKVITDGQGKLRQKWLDRMNYTKIAVVSGIAFFVGLILVGRFAIDFVRAGYALASLPESANHLAISGLALLFGAVLVFTNTLVLHAVAVYVPKPSNRD